MLIKGNMDMMERGADAEILVLCQLAELFEHNFGYNFAVGIIPIWIVNEAIYNMLRDLHLFIIPLTLVIIKVSSDRRW